MLASTARGCFVRQDGGVVIAEASQRGSGGETLEGPVLPLSTVVPALHATT